MEVPREVAAVEAAAGKAPSLARAALAGARTGGALLGVAAIHYALGGFSQKLAKPVEMKTLVPSAGSSFTLDEILDGVKTGDSENLPGSYKTSKDSAPLVFATVGAITIGAAITDYVRQKSALKAEEKSWQERMEQAAATPEPIHR